MSETGTAGRKRRKPGAGHKGKGKGCGPASHVHSDKPRQPLVITPEKQRERALKRWADHRERVAQGPEAVEAHARIVRFEKMRREMKREKRRIHASVLPSPARSNGENNGDLA